MWRYLADERSWVQLPLGEVSSDRASNSLRFATLNVLSDSLTNNTLNGKATLQHGLRYQHILGLIQDLDADVLGLNEVCATFLKMLLLDATVRSTYCISNIDFTELGNNFGNIMLCKRNPDIFHLLKQPHLTRRAVVVGYHRQKIVICATHLSAHGEKVPIRQEQITELSKDLRAVVPSGYDSVIMGDLNLHGEGENKIIPDGYIDLWLAIHKSDVRSGATMDTSNNIMVQFVNPQFLRGCAMRLDRVLLLKAPESGRTYTSMRLWAHKKLYEGWRLPCLPRPLHVLLSWPQCILGILGFNLFSPLRYLFPSDHFGLCVESTVF